MAAINAAVTANLLDPQMPRNLGGGRVHAGATEGTSLAVAASTLTLNFAQRPTGLKIPSLSSITDGQTFVITNSATGRTYTFEFDDSVTNPGVAIGNIAVDFTPTSTLDDIANSIALQINSSTSGVIATNSGNGLLRLAAGTNHSVDVTRTALLRLMDVGGVNDGENFTIRYNNTPVSINDTFEFDRNGALIGTGVIPITITAADTQEDIAAKIDAAITAAQIGASASDYLAPVDFGAGNLQIGGTTNHVLNATNAPSLTVSGLPGVRTATRIQLPVSLALQVPALGGLAMVDGSTFTINDGVKTSIFEFDSDGTFVDVNGDLLPDNQIVAFTPTMTQDQVALSLLASIAGAGLALAPPLVNNPSSGLVILGSTPLTTINLGTANLTSS
ncbi:MAG TPA: hypothetical protein PLV92_27335, partial [Pirellulaceae bacterium]|nr:hypothetical protein [Pirellulaceae bacterium]